MENMGKQKVVNKTISPAEIIKALQAGSMTIAQAQQMYNGVMPIGDYKGIAAIFDLDLLVNQPLALVEGLYSLDRIDERDIITATVPALAPLPTTVTAPLLVPAGELWFLERVGLDCPVTGVVDMEVHVNFRLSNWEFPDVRGAATINPHGRAYLSSDLVAEEAVTIDSTTIFAAGGNLGVQLRLVAGTIITLVATTSGAIGVDALAVTLTPYGRKARILVA